MRLRRPLRPLPLPLALSLAALASCATATLTFNEAEPIVADAEARIAAADHDGALDVLDEVEGDACPRRLRDRRDVALARARFAVGELFEAYEALQDFAADYPLSELRPIAMTMMWDVATALLARDDGFLFFWSDRTGARTVLEHLTTNFPDSTRVGDALKILGDLAYEDGDFDLAQQRYGDLMLNHPDEWVAYARFRYGMSIVGCLEGAEYDQIRTSEAERELAGFLAGGYENPEMNTIAAETVAMLLEWQIEHELGIAGFYARIANAPGELLHLERAAEDRFARTSRHAEAVQRRDAARTRATGAPP
jgi:outer membrane protein assembly factor BamD (BamD/ComL family)